ncbi:MAG: MiaB/RimO family radical SAM methylthiotransferase [Candidatus Dormibacteraeota bacterium]|nr:MiaB/RimO family radical SAM methylthiotransferase [Candidatus Dormibacteraeota bacterium]
MSGAARVALTALGCKVNFAEMSELAGTLAAAGLEVVPEHEHADIHVLNSCTVTLQADATTRQRIRRLRRRDPEAHLVLTGCSVDANPDLYLRRDGTDVPLPPAGVDSVFANRDKTSIALHVLQAAEHRGKAIATPPARARAFIKIQDGCDHRCTYCIVWRARGESRSVPADEVLRRVKSALEAGHAEIVLCGVDLGSWGREAGLRLADLVSRVLQAVPATARLRLSSVNANDVTEQLIELAAHPRLCPHWHMPLQSGSDAVLRAMHRGYRRQQYSRIADRLRAVNSQTTYTTYVMVAFPGETDADHAATLSFIDDIGFLACHVFRWSARPGTPADALPLRVDDRIARRRSAEVQRASAMTAQRSLLGAVGREHQVVWDGVDNGRAHGLAATYHQVLLEGDAAPVRAGGLSTVRATAVDGSALRATLVSS